MISTMSYEMERRRSCGNCLRYCMIVMNIVFTLIAAAAVAVFIYLHITQVEFVSAVLGTDMVVAASFLVIVSGCLLLLLAIFGIIIAIIDRVKPYVVYIVFVVTIFCVMAAGVVCALVFKTWLTEEVRHEMQATLQKVYGVNLDESWNRHVTDSWDKAQTEWKCCSVDDQSWDLYHASQWYKEQEGTPGSKINPRPYVPQSCCVLDSNGGISETNLRKCQTTTDGPPARKQGSQYAGTHNSALHYRGCYEAAQDYLINDTASWFSILVGVGTAVAILLILGIILSVALYITRKREKKTNGSMTAYQYSNPTASQFSLENRTRY